MWSKNAVLEKQKIYGTQVISELCHFIIAVIYYYCLQ